MTCACDRLIGSHATAPSAEGLTFIARKEEPDRYSLVFYTDRYRCDVCQREQIWDSSSHDPDVHIKRP